MKDFKGTPGMEALDNIENELTCLYEYDPYLYPDFKKDTDYIRRELEILCFLIHCGAIKLESTYNWDRREQQYRVNGVLVDEETYYCLKIWLGR